MRIGSCACSWTWGSGPHRHDGHADDSRRDVTVGVLQAPVLMLMRVRFRQHSQLRPPSTGCNDQPVVIARPAGHGERRSNERSGTEMRRGPRGPQVPQRKDKSTRLTP